MLFEQWVFDDRRGNDNEKSIGDNNRFRVWALKDGPLGISEPVVNRNGDKNIEKQ